MGTAAPQVRYCRLEDGGQVAWASLGQGPPLVMLPGWVCHLEESWAHPSAASARERLAAEHRFIWYDRIGCGLSDRDGFEPSLDHDVAQLTAVLDAADVERASLIGYSLGAPPAAAFAARHPERVERVAFTSGFARGAALAAEESLDAVEHLVAANWGMGSRTLATLILPNGSSQELYWFDRFQRRAASPRMAVRLLQHQRSMDVRGLLPRVQVPTLVLHDRDDQAVPLAAGRELAELLPSARLLVFDGNEHDPFIRDAGGMVDAILDFVAGREPSVPAPPRPAPTPSLTPREQEVLRLLAEGEANKEIAVQLHISVATVERHITNLYRKLDARGRADATLAAVAMGLVEASPIG